MKTIVDETLACLKNGESVVTATIIRHKGSTPRETGARLMIRQDGSIVGTIGGGVLEADVIQKGKALFESKNPLFLGFDMSKMALESSAMVCGGKLSVLLDVLLPDNDTISLFEQIKRAFETRQPAILVIQLDYEGEQIHHLSRGLSRDDKLLVGDLSCDQSVLHQISSTVPDSRKPSVMIIDDTHYWAEPLLFPTQLVLFGAGHVSQATARLADITGFQVIVVDDRKELMTVENFSDSIQLLAPEKSEQWPSALELDADSYAVILTRSHQLDKEMLRRCLKAEAAYIGMIGSRRKRDTIYGSLLKEGIKQEQLERVHCPVGLDIGASTPEEIAVSIMAQLITVRSRTHPDQTPQSG